MLPLIRQGEPKVPTATTDYPEKTWRSCSCRCTCCSSRSSRRGNMLIISVSFFWSGLYRTMKCLRRQRTPYCGGLCRGGSEASCLKKSVSTQSASTHVPPGRAPVLAMLGRRTSQDGLRGCTSPALPEEKLHNWGWTDGGQVFGRIPHPLPASPRNPIISLVSYKIKAAPEFWAILFALKSTVSCQVFLSEV